MPDVRFVNTNIKAPLFIGAILMESKGRQNFYNFKVSENNDVLEVLVIIDWIYKWLPHNI